MNIIRNVRGRCILNNKEIVENLGEQQAGIKCYKKILGYILSIFGVSFIFKDLKGKKIKDSKGRLLCFNRMSAIKWVNRNKIRGSRNLDRKASNRQIRVEIFKIIKVDQLVRTNLWRSDGFCLFFFEKKIIHNIIKRLDSASFLNFSSLSKGIQKYIRSYDPCLLTYHQMNAMRERKKEADEEKS